jgi:hypothetical protein
MTSGRRAFTIIAGVVACAAAVGPFLPAWALFLLTVSTAK